MEWYEGLLIGLISWVGCWVWYLNGKRIGFRQGRTHGRNETISIVAELLREKGYDVPDIEAPNDNS